MLSPKSAGEGNDNPTPHQSIDNHFAPPEDAFFQKELEKHLSESDRLAAIGRLSVALVHDINSPLQIIQGYLDLILDFSIDDVERLQYLQIIRDEVKRVSKLTNHIIDYAQPSLFTLSRVSAMETVQRALLFTKKILKEKSITVTVQVIAKGEPIVIAVADELEQVFLNLIMNAYDATPPDGKLEITIQSTKDETIISFANTGKPIPENLIEHIFEPFFTTKSKGGGLGLWVSRYLIESRGGQLTVENKYDGAGVIFNVILPKRDSREIEA